MTSTAVAVTVGTAPIVMFLVQLFKSWIEAWLKPTDPRHDITIQAMAIAVGVAVFVGDAALRSALTSANLTDLIVQGAACAGLAIGGYHWLPTTSAVPTTPLTAAHLGPYVVNVEPRTVVTQSSPGYPPVTTAVPPPASGSGTL